MAQPPLRSLRPARSRGLTSPDQVRTRHGYTATPNPPLSQEPRTSRRTSERQENYTQDNRESTKA